MLDYLLEVDLAWILIVKMTNY